MSAAAAEGIDSNTSQMEAALAESPGPEGAFDHDSDDDFQYEEVEVPR